MHQNSSLSSVFKRVDRIPDGGWVVANRAVQAPVNGLLWTSWTGLHATACGGEPLAVEVASAMHLAVGCVQPVDVVALVANAICRCWRYWSGGCPPVRYSAAGFASRGLGSIPRLAGRIKPAKICPFLD